MKLHDAQKRGIPKQCVVCRRPYLNPYGRWGDGGTCSKECEIIYEAQPRYERVSDGNQLNCTSNTNGALLEVQKTS